MSDRISGAAMVHLENALGPDLAQVIFDPKNVKEFREFAECIKKGYRISSFLEKKSRRRSLKALLRPDNAKKVKEFCDQLIRDNMLMKMNIWGRVYEIIDFVREMNIEGDSLELLPLSWKFQEMGMSSSREDGLHLLEHQADIPAVVCDSDIVFLFLDWRDGGDPFNLYHCIYNDGEKWLYEIRSYLPSDWKDTYKVLRRIK